jgi:hypothetical protein
MEENQRNIRLASSNDKHTVWIGGDFNLPEINWEDLDNIRVKENSKNADIHQEFIELTCVEKKPNIKVHSATSYLIFQYLQYWYNQYFPEYSSICNTGIISISQNPPVSAILVLPVFPRIFRYLQYSYFANDQYLLVLQILEDSGILVFTRICTSIADTGRFW